MVTSFSIKDFSVPTHHPDFQYFVYQVEKCPTTGKEHIQGYLELKKQVAFNSVKMMFSPAIVHLEQRRAKTNTKAIEYCTKAESRLRGPWHFGEATDASGAKQERINWIEIRAKLWNFRTWTDVLRSDDPDIMKAVGHKSAFCLELFQARPVMAPEPEITLRKWQKKVLEMLDGPVVKRRIIWIWSEASGTGKTTFFDYCSSKYAVIPGADWGNTLFIYDGQSITWFDRTRAQQWDDRGVNEFYSMLERLSNSSIHTSTKYRAVPKYISCHVVVTANCLPDETRIPNRCVVIRAKTTEEEEDEEQQMLDDFEREIEEEYVKDLCNNNVVELSSGSLYHPAQSRSPSPDFMHNTPTPPRSPPGNNDSFWESALQAAYGTPDNYVSGDDGETEQSRDAEQSRDTEQSKSGSNTPNSSQ